MNYLLSEIDSIHHMNILLMLGIAAFTGTIGARIFQKLKIPQVVGYIAIGILLGGAFLNIANKEVIKSLSPLNLFALGLIGFRIGGELKIDIFKKYGKQFTIILLSEGLFAFVVVSILISVLGGLLTGNWGQSVALGLLLGAISSATAPAATVDVLWEYKTRGILTRTVLAIVALDDGLSLFLYGFAASIAGALTGSSQSLLESFLFPLWEIFGGIAVGAAAGGILLIILRTVTDKAKVLTFSLALIAMMMGLSNLLKVEGILAAMVAGALITNFRPRKSQSLFNLDESFAPPIYALFFVLVGARLELANLPIWMLVLALAYVIGRTGGKMFGAWFGGKISNSPESVRKYLGYCLFSQAGVAIGLSILAGERFPNA
ncbi:MAG: cation:proton antiporter, partial [Phycisphaerae bacterium]|nr:cation:proton antiporter [Phycisphaerae bacterium]